MKELWIEIDKSFPDKVKNSLMKSAAKFDALLVNSRDIENARKTGAKTAAATGDCDINVLEIFDENKAKKLKEAGKTVAVKVSIRAGKIIFSFWQSLMAFKIPVSPVIVKFIASSN